MISSSHGARVTFCVVAEHTVSCDVEAVAARSDREWSGLLGTHEALAGLVCREPGEDAGTAGTRVWAAVECLRKAGLPADAPLTLTTAGTAPWMVFAVGAAHIATLVTAVRDVPDPVVFAVLTEGRI